MRDYCEYLSTIIYENENAVINENASFMSSSE